MNRCKKEVKAGTTRVANLPKSFSKEKGEHGAGTRVCYQDRMDSFRVKEESQWHS